MMRFLHSRYCVAVAIMASIAMAMLFYALCGPRFAVFSDAIASNIDGQWLRNPLVNLALALGANIAVTLMLANVNKTHNLLRSMTMLQGSMFIIMQASYPQGLTMLGPGSLLCLVVVACMYLMYGSYGQLDPQRQVFLVFLLLSGCAAFDYGFVIYIPVFWLACAQMRILSLRTVLASLMGIATPWIIMLGFGLVRPSDIVIPDVYTAKSALNSAAAVTAVVVPAVFSAFVAFGSWVQNVIKFLTYNAQSRAMLGLVTVVMMVSTVAMVADYKHAMDYLPLVNCCGALQLGHVFGVLLTGKKSAWAIISIIAIYIIIYAWNTLTCIS